MTAIRYARLIAAVTFALSVVACGSGDDAPPPPPPDQSVGNYLQALPSWDQFSPPVEDQDPKVVSATPVVDTELVNEVKNGVFTTTQYKCLSTEFDMRKTPEKIVMFSPDREILWPGALLQGKSHKDGVGSLLGLPIRERAPIKVSIPSLATDNNFVVVENPDQATVSQAIGDLISSVPASVQTPSSIQFTMEDYNSEESFALKANMSGKYMGFSMSASASYNRAANERTVMVYFVEKMYEVVVEPPQTPVGFFNADFTKARLDEQVALGRIGPSNLPVYVSNVVYGRIMAFTFTSTASETDIKAALNAAYKGLIVKVEGGVQSEHEKILAQAKYSITSLGGPSAASVAMIASGQWQEYFKQTADLSSAYPISYTFRNLGDGSIAKVSETDKYTVRECAPAGGNNFVLDSFESQSGPMWQPAPDPSSTKASPLTIGWRDAATEQAIFYAYQAVTHKNLSLRDLDWIYNVGYIAAPNHFINKDNDYDRSVFWRGELSFWYKPAPIVEMEQAGTTRHCWTHWIWYFPPIWETRCVDLPAALPSQVGLKPSDQVWVYDDQTTADQIIMRGGGDAADGALLTITYNPPETARRVSHGWQKLVLGLTNHDRDGRPLCSYDKPFGCWMVEDRMATEEEIKYVLGNLQQLYIRASYPVYLTESCEITVAIGAQCPADKLKPLAAPVPLGFVGGYFDEIRMTQPEF
jgi:hypothetical protein